MHVVFEPMICGYFQTHLFKAQFNISNWKRILVCSFCFVNHNLFAASTTNCGLFKTYKQKLPISSPCMQREHECLRIVLVKLNHQKLCTVYCKTDNQLGAKNSARQAISFMQVLPKKLASEVAIPLTT